MNLGRAISTFGKSAALRLGSQNAARQLLDDLSSPDENVRMLAGMFLVKSGKRAVPALRESLETRDRLATVLTILGDIAAPETEPDIARFLDDDDPEVATAARLALDALRRNQKA